MQRAAVWNHTKDHNRSRKLCFHQPGHVPVIRGHPDLHFEGAGNGPVVITWIGKEHELYSGASPISLVEHCVTFRHDRWLLSLLGFVHNWQQKKENRFSLNGNGIMSSFLGRQFYHSTLYFLQLRDLNCQLMRAILSTQHWVNNLWYFLRLTTIFIDQYFLNFLYDVLFVIKFILMHTSTIKLLLNIKLWNMTNSSVFNIIYTQ